MSRLHRATESKMPPHQQCKGSKHSVFRDQTEKTIPQAPGLRDGCRLEQTLRC